MKGIVFKSSVITILMFLAFVSAFGQGEDNVPYGVIEKHVISARAGGINYVSGPVLFKNSLGELSTPVLGSALDDGEVVTTGNDGKLEALLNPGSYVRIGSNSEMSFKSTDLGNIQVSVTKGSAIFEVIARKGYRIAVQTPGSMFYLTKTGIYRVDVLPNGVSRLEVIKGKAQIGNLDATTVKKSRAAIVGSNSVAIEKFDTGDRDELEQWSRDRSKFLAERNRTYEKSMSNDVYAYSNGRDAQFNSQYGIWGYDASNRLFSFLPIGLYRSPYGFRYGYGIYEWYSYQYYNRVSLIYVPQNNAFTTGNSGNGLTTAPGTAPTEPGRPNVTPGNGAGSGQIGVMPRLRKLPPPGDEDLPGAENGAFGSGGDRGVYSTGNSRRSSDSNGSTSTSGSSQAPRTYEPRRTEAPRTNEPRRTEAPRVYTPRPDYTPRSAPPEPIRRSEIPMPKADPKNDN
ncbi:MAG: FecR domain-containing protein [Pyrinomonadaceae bacterium]